MLNLDNEQTEELQDIDSVENIDPSTIHSVFAIKDGMFEMVEKTELEKKNYFYRVHSKVPGIVVIDYDKTNVVPIVKDILNRQNTFIEIKYLRWVVGIEIFIVLGMIILGILIPFGKSNFETQKSEIIAEIKKYGTQNIQKPIESPVIITPQSSPTTTQSSPTTTQSSGYSPILPEGVSQNNHKNIPKYAN